MPNIVTQRHDIIPLGVLMKKKKDMDVESGGDLDGSGLPRRKSEQISLRDRFLSLIYAIFPILSWGPKYQRENFAGDIVAGLTVGVMVIPQSMAYAIIAELPPVYGLYSSMITVFVYMCMGTSRHLAVGPTAILSLLTASAIEPITTYDDNPDLYITLALVLCVLSGLIQIGLGMLRMGFLVNLLSHPVISGFTSGAAVIIGSSQLKHIFSIEPHGHEAYEVIYNTFAHLGDTHVLTMLLGFLWLAILMGFKRLGKMKPKFRQFRSMGPLVVVTVSTLITYLARLDKEGVKIIEDVPSGLPSPIFPDFGDVPSSKWGGFIGSCVAMSFVGFMESISIAKSLGIRHQYDVDANQELIAIGAANLVGGMFRSYPITGSFSRSAICSNSGGRTAFYNFFVAFVVGLTLVALTPLFFYLPKNVLAGIVLNAVFGLVTISEAKFLWKVNRQEFFLFVFTFIMTITVGVELGILISMGLSLVIVIHESARPHYAVLGKTKYGNIYRSIKRYPDSIITPHVVHIRLDAPLYFANVTYVKELLAHLERLQDVPLQFVIIDAAPISSVDATALHAVREIYDEYRSRHVELYFANVNERVRLSFEKSGLYDLLTDARFFETNHSAVLKARAMLVGEDYKAPISISRSCSTDSLFAHISDTAEGENNLLLPTRRHSDDVSADEVHVSVGTESENLYPASKDD